MTCNKKYFDSKKRAKKKAKELWHAFWQKFEVYRCNECNQIHLTSKKTVGEKEFFRKKKFNN